MVAKPRSQETNETNKKEIHESQFKDRTFLFSPADLNLKKKKL